MTVYSERMMAKEKPHSLPMRLRAVSRWFRRKQSALLLVVTFGSFCWTPPLLAEAATDTYYFQNVASSSVCTGTSTINQSSEANVLPGGALVTSNNYQTGGWYHFNWDAGATTAATSLANDIYTAQFTTATKITALKLRMDHIFSYNIVGYQAPANLYAKFFDVDGNAPCPGFEQGTLIAQTPTTFWLFFADPPNNSTIAANGLYYAIQPGHRIRVELWNNFAPGKNLQIKYGSGTTTGLDVEYLPPPPAVPPTSNTTVTTGTAPPSVSLAPGGAATTLHNFTLQTSSGTDSINRVIVGITPHTAASVIGMLSIYNDAGNINYGSAYNPTSDLITIGLASPITATTTPTQYRVVVTPKNHASMPAAPGASYAITGTVEGINSLSAYTGIYYDTANSTVTIDNLSPTTPTLGSSSAGDSTVTLNWTNHADADFHSVVVLRGTAVITATPVEGTSYTAGTSIGSSTVAYAGNLQTFTDGLVDTLWNGTPYYYKIFARDAYGNYSFGANVGPFTPMQSGTGTAVVGDGANPPNSLIGVLAGGKVDLDAFTLTSWPPTHLTSVSVTLPPGTFGYTSTVYLHASDNEIYPIRSVAPTSDTVVLSGLNIPITNVISSFKIKMDKMTTLNTPPPPGTETAMTGKVTAITLDNPDMNIAYNDTASATVTIDHKAPANPVLQYATPTDSRIDLKWTNPDDTDTVGTLILRNTVPVTDAPKNGYTYSGIGWAYIGTSLLIHNNIVSPSSVETKTSSGLNDTAFYYKIFSYDEMHNYSTGLSVGPITPYVTVSVGNGTNPANTIIAPGSGAASLDAFTLESTSSAFVSSVTATLSAGSLDVVGSVRIASGDGLTVYGSVDNPASETVTIPTTGLGATITPAECRIEIIPKTHTTMPAVPGAEVAVTGLVTAVTTAATSYRVNYNDTTSAAVTVDNLSPANPAGIAAISLDSGFNVSWANPPDADYSSLMVLRDTAPVTGLPVEGVSYTAGMSIGTSMVAYEGNQQSFIERGMTNGANYYYRLFARDSSGNYSAGGSPIGPLSPLPSNRTVAGSATAIIQGLDAISVTMPYTDDANGNGTCAVEYKLSAGSVWTPWSGGISRSTTACTTTITGLTAGSRYDVRMTYGDSDGVLGTVSQTVTGIVALSLIQTTAGTVTAAFSDSSTITVTAPFTNDYNHDNSVLVEYKLSSDSDWTTWGTFGPANSPYTADISGLSQLIRYDVHVTFIDPDGVNGAAVQTISGLLTPSAKNARLIHNSLNTNHNNYWGPYGWGVPGGMYGEFTCQTCHTNRTTNASGIKTNIMGRSVRFDGPAGRYSFGNDAVPKWDWQTGTFKICEVCHTQTSGVISWTEVQPGVWEPTYGPIHRISMSEPSDHASSNGRDCTQCHPHNNGFGVRMW